jgi:Glyoxalase-like domain
MAIRIQSTCVDSADPRALASFWEAVLGWRRTYDSDDEVGLEPRS